MRLKLTRILPVCLAVLLVFLWTTLSISISISTHQSAVQAQEPVEPAICDDVRYLMAQDATPYDLNAPGTTLAPDEATRVQFKPDVYSQFYAFKVVLPRDNFNNPVSAADIRLTFSGVPENLNLEFAVFRNMVKLRDYAPVTDGTVSVTVRQDTVYTVAIRRQSLYPQAMAAEGEFTLTASYPGDTDIVLGNLRDNSTGSQLLQPPVLVDGLTRIPISESTQVNIHTGSAISVASQGGQGAQVRFDGGAILFGAWAQKIDILGGDLAARGTTPGGNPRIFFLQDYGYLRELFNENLNIEDTNGTKITTDWQGIKGLWLLRDCIGIKLLDGRTFVAPTQPAARQVTFTGGLNAMTVRLNTFNRASQLLPYDLVIDWRGVLANSEAHLLDGILTLKMDGGKQLLLESTRITMARRSSGDEPAIPLDIRLADRAALVTLDFVNMGSFALTGDTIAIQFTDRRAELTPTVTRTANRLERFEALNDVIQLVYQAVNEQTPGEQRLLLPRGDNYIEIITPAGFPTFDSTALPDEPGYAPRGLNNLGGECYPVNTTLIEANCPPNGDINPANENLWYSVTDLRAFGGYGLDLTLTRSYNSRAINGDGPFGRGWTTEYLLNTSVPFDRVEGSRPVTPEALAAYRVGLDVTYAPRGIVTFTTFSGSRHVFASQQPAYTTGTLRALTMPGWTLTRPDIRANWTLRQSDGFTYEFDRAGRLVSYGYPKHSRIINVEYVPELNNVVRISDDFGTRQLELYYDENQHISRSVLRDTKKSEPFSECLITSQCFETLYLYEDGRLTTVIYDDGQTATYVYDAAGRMIQHNDPRAPIAPRMIYNYTEQRLESIFVETDGEPLPWRIIQTVQGDRPPERKITIKDELERTRQYTYAIVDKVGLRETGSGYTLLSVTSPLVRNDNIRNSAEEPQLYTWDDGLLTQIGPRLIADNVGRNSTTFRYTPGGNLQNISGGFLDFDLVFDNSGLPISARFADDTALTYTYNPDGLPETITDRYGANYVLQWDSAGKLTSRRRTNDGQTWAYTHNQLGQIASITTGNQTTRYAWDNFGRLTGVVDPLYGTYSITYNPPFKDDTSTILANITVTDAAGVETISTFDYQGRLVETRLATRANPNLRHITYSYDLFDRLVEETVHIEQSAGADNPPRIIPLTTRYIYTPVASLVDPDRQVTINGYSITKQDPYGRREIYTFDAFNRIRQVEDSLRRVTRYDYDNTPSVLFNNGFRITQRDLRGTQLFATTVYDLDLRGQLRTVNRTAGSNTIAWTLITEGDPVKPRFLEAVGADIISLTWNGFQGAAANSVELRPVVLPLESTAAQPPTRLSTVYDFLNRPTQITDGRGVTTRTAYCVNADGSTETRSSTPGQAADTFGCDSDIYAERQVYDLHHRLISATDAFGTRTFDYRYDLEAQAWVVTVAAGDRYTWELRYNPAGDLIYWLDEAGIVHEYEHDGAGRLTRVRVPDAPEASFTFTYNAAGLLTSQVDDLGRGSLYQYDERGLLLVEQDVQTADASTFAYGPFGEMTSAISPLGNTTTFRYDDPADPTRLTGVIDPTGVLETFTWNDVDNTLIYADARGNRTRYTFDALGQLWRLDDAAGQSHELHYDSAGKLSAVLSAQPSAASGESALRTLRLTPMLDGAVSISEEGITDWQWVFNFNTSGALTWLTDPQGFAFNFEYDRLGRVRQAATGDYRWTLEREPGVPRIDFNGMKIEFDSLYRLTRETAPTTTDDENPLTTRYTYGSGTRGDTTLKIERNDENPRIYTFSPGDSSAQPRTVTLQAPGQTLTYTYNAEGLIEEFRTDACIADAVDSCIPGQGTVWTTSIRFNYDTQGRPIRIVDQEQNVETFAYDDLGNLIAYQTPNGKTFNYTYDNLNRLLTIVSPTGIKVLLRYDALNNVTGVCRTRAEAPNNFAECENNDRVIETYTYDSLGRLIGQTFPNTGSVGGVASIQRTYTGNWLTRSGIVGQPNLTINREYQSNALALLSRFITDVTAYDFAYDGDLRVTQAGTGAYTYDAFGRVTTLTEGGSTYSVNRLPEGRGYSLSDGETQVLYGLDARGFLSVLDYGLAAEPADIPLLSIQYRLNPRQPDILSVVMNSNDATKTLDMQMNERSETRNITMSYHDQRLLVDYITDAVGLVTRQRIDGSPSKLFDEGAGGYIIVTGYDDDNRPTTARITDKRGGRLLYVLNYTYNESGQRLTETRRYADNTQMIIRYEYGTPNQLTRRTIQIVPPVAAAALPGIVVLLLIPMGMIWRRQSSKPRLWTLIKHLALPGTAIILTGLLVIVSDISAQQQVTQTYSFDYIYDAAGNISRIQTPDPQNPTQNLICREYIYDSTNRLIGLQLPDREITLSYQVDLYNRLIGIDQKTVLYAGKQPFALRDAAGSITYYGRIGGKSPIWLAGDAGEWWQMPDGRDRVLTIDNTDEPVRLLDPAGRVIALSIPAASEIEDFNPCTLNDDYVTSEVLFTPQPEFNNLLNIDFFLYLGQDGRAYDPVIGRFLQRNPEGPSELGSVYEIGQPQPVPVQRRPASTLSGGIMALRDALAVTHTGQNLTAAAIAQQYLPAPRPTRDWTEALANPLALPGSGVNQMAELLTLPAWLQSAYNLPGANFTLTSGAIRLDTGSTPGHGGLQALPPTLLQPSTMLMLPTAPLSPLAALQGMVGQLNLPVKIPYSYDSRLWLPNGTLHLAKAWRNTAPRIGREYTPGIVLDSLPQPLTQPQTAADLLTLVEKLIALPEMTGQDWLQTMIYDSLPQLPELPAQDAAMWRKQWFTDDTLGLAHPLTKSREVPPLPYLPTYRIGYNPDWMFIQQAP